MNPRKYAKENEDRHKGQIFYDSTCKNDVWQADSLTESRLEFPEMGDKGIMDSYCLNGQKICLG